MLSHTGFLVCFFSVFWARVRARGHVGGKNEGEDGKNEAEDAKNEAEDAKKSTSERFELPRESSQLISNQSP